MKIALIAMSGVRVKSRELAELGVSLPSFIDRGKVIASMPSLGLLTVAGLTPPEHEVHYVEIENFSEPDALPECDLVGLSSMTAQIDQAYRIADAYRERGTKVVIGGLHASAMPDEAANHADAVVIGGAERTWPQVIADAQTNKLRRIYHGARDRVFESDSYSLPRFDFLHKRAYNRVTIQTSRGCPRGCEFCAASLRITDRFQQKPAPVVIDEIRRAKRFVERPFFEFADDNTFLNRAWSRDLLRALEWEEIRYFTETDCSVADDLELCDMLARSGCRQLLIGFESPAVNDLSGIDPMNWKRNQAPRYRQVIDRLQSRGISVNGCFVLGLDNQTEEVFPEVLEFVRTSGLAEVQFTVLTPFPGTPLFERLKREGRLLSKRFWDACTLFDVNFVPKRMSVRALERGLEWLFREAYGTEEVRRRKRTFANSARSDRRLQGM